ncbi:TPA: YiiG family protein, partial [Listeria monocytogenes]|nr:YiiG family protein [Listeria monocytogenes]
MNYFKKSGLSLLIIALSISLLAGCDKEKKADTATEDSLYSKETLVKYNDYVNLSNAINDDFLNARAYYLKNYSDENGNFKQLSSNDIFIPIRTPAETANAITTMKDSISETPSFPIDKGIQELSTDLANEIRILNDLQTYFASKSYLDDDFVEARSLHKELVNSVKKSNKEIQTFNDAMQKINTEQQKFAAEKMKKSGELTPLALNNFISDSEIVIAELRKQEVTAANVVEL